MTRPPIASVGAFAAKVAVATILESQHADPQLLPGEQAVIGLRANLDLAESYNATQVGETNWHGKPASRAICREYSPA